MGDLFAAQIPPKAALERPSEYPPAAPLLRDAPPEENLSPPYSGHPVIAVPAKPPMRVLGNLKAHPGRTSSSRRRGQPAFRADSPRPCIRLLTDRPPGGFVSLPPGRHGAQPQDGLSSLRA